MKVGYNKSDSRCDNGTIEALSGIKIGQLVPFDTNPNDLIQRLKWLKLAICLSDSVL